MQNWENLIAERTKLHGVVKTCRIEDPVKRNRHNHDVRYDRSPKRIAQHRAWAQSPAGKQSMRNRRKRYRATENGKTKHRQGCLRRYYKHRDNPSWMAHLLETQMYQKARRKAAKVLAGIPFEISFTLQDAGSLTVHIYKGVS